MFIKQKQKTLSIVFIQKKLEKERKIKKILGCNTAKDISFDFVS